MIFVTRLVFAWRTSSSIVKRCLAKPSFSASIASPSPILLRNMNMSATVLATEKTLICSPPTTCVLRRRYPVESECAFQRNYEITSMLRQRNDFHFHLSMAFRSVYAARQTLYHAISAHLREFPPRNALPFRLCNGKYFIRNIHVTYFQTVISLLYLMTLCQYGAKNHFQYHKAPVAIKSQTKAKVAKL